MGTKTLIQLLAILVICLAIFGIVKCSSSKQGVSTVASSTEKKKVFDQFEINKVAQVKITEKDQSVTLNRGEKHWEVADREDFPGDTSKVVELIRKIWDLEIAQPVPLQRDQYGRVALKDPADEETPDDEAATVVAFFDSEGKELGSLWLGKVHEASEGRPNPFGGGMMTSDVGRFVKRGGSNLVYIVSETFRNAEAKPTDWINSDFFEISKIKSISRKTKNPEDDWSLTREELTGDFELVDPKEGEELDPTKVTAMKSAFSGPRFDDIFVGDEAETPDFSVFTIETFDGFTYEIAAGEKNDLNELPLTVKVSGKFPDKREEGEEESDEEKKKLDEDFAKEIEKRKEKLAKEKEFEGRVFKVRGFVVDSITKTRSEILKEKKEEEKKPETDKPEEAEEKENPEEN